MYEPYPTLKYRWNPNPRQAAPYNRQYNVQGVPGVDLGPHPADPMAAHIASQANDGQLEGPNILEQRVLGKDIYVYSGRGGWVLSCTDPYFGLADSWHSAMC